MNHWVRGMFVILLHLLLGSVNASSETSRASFDALSVLATSSVASDAESAALAAAPVDEGGVPRRCVCVCPLSKVVGVCYWIGMMILWGGVIASHLEEAPRVVVGIIWGCGISICALACCAKDECDCRWTLCGHDEGAVVPVTQPGGEETTEVAPDCVVEVVALSGQTIDGEPAVAVYAQQIGEQ